MHFEIYEIVFNLIRLARYWLLMAGFLTRKNPNRSRAKVHSDFYYASTSI